MNPMSKLPLGGAPSSDEQNELRSNTSNNPQPQQAAEQGKGAATPHGRIWRRKDGITQPHNSVPLARVGEQEPPQPTARLNDSIRILKTTTTTSQHTPFSAEALGESSSPAQGTRKLIAKIPEALLATLRNNCTKKASVSVLGSIHGKHPGLKALTAWAREALHPTLELLSLKSNNVFEATFATPEGRTHALNQTDLTCESAAIYFSSWRPHFDPKSTHEADRLDHPVWVQIVDLCQVLREEAFLRTIGAQLGQVISIDSSDAYKAKLFGPRIRLLVRDLTELPQTVIILRLDGEGTVEYALEFSGLPNQCGRCRSRDHQVRFCPKKDLQDR